MNYSIKDLKKALDHLESKYKTINIIVEIDDMQRIHLTTMDTEANSVKITIYKNEDNGTKMPTITKTERL